MCRCRGIIHISAHLARSWLAVRIADLTPDLQVLLSLGLAVVSFNSQQYFSVRFFHVIVGLPTCHQPVYTCCSGCSNRTLHRCNPAKPSVSQTVLIGHKLKFCQLLSWFTVATSSVLILQICPNMTLSLSRCKWPSFHCYGAWHAARKSCTHDHRSCKKGGRMW